VSASGEFALVNRVAYLRTGLVAWDGSVVLALATFVVPLLKLGIRKGTFLNMITFSTVLVVCSIFIVRLRQQRDLREEIDDLIEIERLNKC
jgi:hypothetical protein